jgi:hypothetical protein
VNVRVHDHQLDGGEPEAPEDGLVRLWFCSSTWNSRMTFTAKSCELEWEG